MRLPVVYIPHGGGPWPFVDVRFAPPDQWAPLEAYLRSLVTSLSERPRALLVVSAHWEEPSVTLMTAARPPMLYDYSGFAPAAFELVWPAPCALDLVPRASALLRSAGIPFAEDAQRGFDHGTFIPLMLSVPSAEIPVLQVSLLESLDPDAHLRLGRALAPLRDEGVLVIGSGSSFHNMRAFGRPADYLDASRRFDAWIESTVGLPRSEREDHLRQWRNAPGALECHPREEHLLPLHVVAGAALDDRGAVPARCEILGLRMSAVAFAS